MVATINRFHKADEHTSLTFVRWHLKKSTAGSARNFLATVKRYTRMKKLTPEILREFVDKIVVHHRVRIGVASTDCPAVERQEIEILYNCVGSIAVPDVAKVPQVEVVMPIRKGVTACYSSSQQVANF